MLECEAFQIFCPLFNFSTLEMFPVFPAFPVFLGKKKRGKSGGKKSCWKKLFDKNGPNKKDGVDFRSIL